MINEEQNENQDHLKNLENQEIDGRTILGGGAGDIDHNDVPVSSLANGVDEIGYDTTVIPLEEPIFGGDRILTGDDAPPINQGPNFNVTPGFQNGNT